MSFSLEILDPAYLRLKLATRTFISAIIAASIAIPLGFLAMAMAIFGSMFIAAAIYGRSYLEKLKYAAIYSTVIVVCFSIGTLISVNFWISSPILIVSTFLAFYVRRFEMTPSKISIPALVLILLPVLYDISTSVLWIGCAGLAIGCPIVTLLILPERKSAIFSDNFTHQLQLNVKLLNGLIDQLQQHVLKVKSKKIIHPLKERVAATLIANQMISGEFNARHMEIAKLINEILTSQYHLSKALENLMDSINYIISENTDQQIEKELSNSICQILSTLVNMTESIEVINYEIHLKNANASTQTDTTIALFKQTLTQYSYKEHTNIIYFYNCYTSIRLYWDVLSTLRNVHATGS